MFKSMFRLALILCLVLVCNSPVQSDPNNQPWGDTWKGIKQLEVNDSVNSFFGQNDMTWVDGFRFSLQADGKVKLTAQGPGKRFGYTIEVSGYGNDSKSRNKNPAVWSHPDLKAGGYFARVLWHDNVKVGPIPKTTYNLSLSYTPHQGSKGPGGQKGPKAETVPRADDTDGWLGVWEVRTYAKGCPGPEPDGAWLGFFHVFKDSNGYHFRWLHEKVDADILEIEANRMKIILKDPGGSEMIFTRSGNTVTYTQEQKLLLKTNPSDSCAKAKGKGRSLCK